MQRTKTTQDKFGRINARVLRKAYDLLTAEIDRRSLIEPRKCTQGTVLTEIIIKCLSPVAAENEIPPLPAEPESIKRMPRRARTA